MTPSKIQAKSAAAGTARAGSLPWPQWVDPVTKLPLADAGDRLTADSGAPDPVRDGIPRFVPANTDLRVGAWLPLHRAIAPRTRVWQAIWSRFSPLLAWCHIYRDLSDELQRQFAYLDTHESLTDWFKHLRNTSQIRDARSALGATDIDAWRGGIGVEARACKPA